MSDATYLLTSPSGQRMLTYVAPVYFQSRVAMAIFQANGQEVDDLVQWTAEIRDQLFPQRATWGLKYWENELGLPTNETLPIATRRQAVLSKLVTRVPITPAKIKEIAQQSTKKTATVENRISANTFRIIIESDGSGVDLVALNQAINIAKPAHLTAEYGIGYNNGVQIDAEMSIIGQGPLAFAGDSLFCGTFPAPHVTYVERAATIQAVGQVSAYTKADKYAGTKNCGEVVT